MVMYCQDHFLNFTLYAEFMFYNNLTHIGSSVFTGLFSAHNLNLLLKYCVYKSVMFNLSYNL